MSLKEQEHEEPKEAKEKVRKSKKESKEGKEAKEGKPKKEKEPKPKKPKRKISDPVAESDESNDEPKKKRVRKVASPNSSETKETKEKTKSKTSTQFTSALNKVRRGTAVVFNTESNAPCFLSGTMKVAADLEQWHSAKEKNETETLMIVDITTLEIAMPLRVISLQPVKYMNNGLFLDHEKLAFCFSQSDLSGSQNHTKKQSSVPDALKPQQEAKKPAKKASTKPVVQEWFFQVQDAKGHSYGMTMATFSELMQHKKIAPIEITEKNEFTMATDDDRMFLVPKEYVDGVWKTNSKVEETLSDVTPAISEAFMKALEN